MHLRELYMLAEKCSVNPKYKPKSYSTEAAHSHILAPRHL